MDEAFLPYFESQSPAVQSAGATRPCSFNGRAKANADGQFRMGEGETLHYQSVVPTAAADGDAAAEGFFDLANAKCVRYTVARGELEALGGGGGDVGMSGDGEKAASTSYELVVEQDQGLHDSCGGIVWESAYALEQYMRRNLRRICESPPVKRKRGGVSSCKVLELGAGAGLLGLAVAVRGAKATVLTDHPNAMPLLERNVRRNASLFESGGNDAPAGGKKRKKSDDADPIAIAKTKAKTSKTSSCDETKPAKPTCMPMDWTIDAHVDAVANQGPFDLILATDVVFNKDLVDPLLNAIRKCGGARTAAYVCVQERCADAFEAFRSRAHTALGACVEVPREELRFVDEACVLFELKATSEVFPDA